MEDQDSSVRFPVGADIFYLLHIVQSGSEARPTPFPPCTGDFSAGIKRLERESDRLIKLRAEVNLFTEPYFPCFQRPLVRYV